MGTSFDQINDVEFDTGSGWFSLQTVDCTGCYDETYDYSSSSAYKPTNSNLKTTYSDGTSISGILAYDNVCLGAS